MLNSSITFKVLPFCTNTAVPAFLPCLEASLSPFLDLCQVPAAIPLESLQWCRIFDPLSEASAWGRGKFTGGQIGWLWVIEDHCHVVLGQKLRNFKGPLSRRIVMVDNGVLVLPLLWPLAPHIFTQPSYNITYCCTIPLSPACTKHTFEYTNRNKFQSNLSAFLGW